MSLLASARTRAALGWWRPSGASSTAESGAMADLLWRLGTPLALVSAGAAAALAAGGEMGVGSAPPADAEALFGIAPGLKPEHLGDPAFCAAYGLRYAYVAGAMANGIGSEAVVEAMSRAGMLGFFGAGGLPLARVEAAIDRVQAAVGDGPYGFNLLHAPNEPDHEMATVELYLRKGVKLVEAAAYLDLTLPLVRYRTAGIHLGPDGAVVTPNRVIAKISRVEVASKFLTPAPEAMLKQCVERGWLTAEQAALAARVPVAEDLTAEADSGGHTDNRPAIALFPTMLALRDAMQARHGYAVAPRVGLAGGVATPQGVAAAFAMGAAFVVTGSINQACVESGSSDAVREMLAGAQQADVAMAPAGDMFEMGVKVQVLKRGTMFPMRAAKLYELYRAHAGLDEIPADQRTALERDLFRAPLETIWEETRAYFATRDPNQVTRAERDPKHKMALVFRWYLGHASRWANAGEPTRKLDYQVWCGPAMGAFNEWTKGSHLAAPAERRVAHVALNLLVGACALRRLDMLRPQAAAAGLTLPPALAAGRVLTDDALAACLA